MSSAQLKEQLFSKIKAIDNSVVLATIDLYVSQWSNKQESASSLELVNLERGIAQADQGQLLTHKEVMERAKGRLQKWKDFAGRHRPQQI